MKGDSLVLIRSGTTGSGLDQRRPNPLNPMPDPNWRHTMNVARTGLGVLAGASAFLGSVWTLSADPPPVPAEGPPKEAKDAKGAKDAKEAKGKPVEKADDDTRVAVAVARDRAKLMHDIYSATLDTMHHRYFRREGAVLPARALEDVFKEIDRKTKIKARWIAVNTPTMSVNHEPETAFEKKAAAELAAGKAESESTEKGFYLHAGPIPLGAGCVGCHTKFGATDEKTPRLAGLVISIPVKDE